MLNDSSPLGSAAIVTPKPVAGAVGVLPRTEGQLMHLFSLLAWWQTIKS